MRPQPDPGRRAVRSPELQRLEIGPVPEDRVAGRVGFGPWKGADAVYEAAAPPNRVGNTRHDGHLQSCEPRELVLLRAPQEFGPASRRAKSGTGRVDEHGVECRREGRPSRVLDENAPVHAEALERRGDETCTRRVGVRGDQITTWLHEARGVRGLAAGAGTRVEDAFPRFRVERTNDERRRLILDGERSGG